MKTTKLIFRHLLTLDARDLKHDAQLLPATRAEERFSGTLSTATGEFRSSGGTWRVGKRGLFTRILDLRDASGEALARFVPRLGGLIWDLRLANGSALNWRRGGFRHRYEFTDGEGSTVARFSSAHWYADGTVRIEVPENRSTSEPGVFAAVVLGSYLLARRYQSETVSLV
jgi:hypothetical protein